MKETFIFTLINLLIIFFIPFLILGVIKKTKAFWGGRKGVSLFQPLYDFIKLLNKARVISNTTSWIFNLSSVVVFVATIFASLFAPICCGIPIINIEAGFIVFSYILGLGKFFALISAMDTGSSFEGMGASREACFTTIVEPAFFVILASIIALTGNTTFSSLTSIIQNSGSYGILIIFMAILALGVMLLTECSRVPVDDPTTHLELTMIHEVMILDNSGIDFALITWASGIKMLILMSLIANLIIPAGLGFAISTLLLLIIYMILAIIIGTLESAIARFRMTHVFEFVFVMSSFALVIASLVALKIYGV